MYRTIGIIGGMGPAATCDLMKKIIENTAAEDDQHHIHLVVDSNTSIPDRTAAILSGGESPVPEMVKSAVRLQAMGADFLIMPCNTAHYFCDQIRPFVEIPILHMIRETAMRLKEQGIRKAALLATNGTVRSGIYQGVMDEAGIELVYPSPDEQTFVMSLAYDWVKRGITDPKLLPGDRMRELSNDLVGRGAERIILGCTELPIAFAGMPEIPVSDPTLILAEAAIRFAGAKTVADAENKKG